MNLIDKEKQSSNRKYTLLRDDARFVKQREYIEALWDRYSEFAEPGFSDEIRRQFHPRFWEIYLGCSFLDMGLELIPKSSSFGPDFEIQLKEKRIWVEAIAPDAGTGDDAVPGYSDEVMQVPEEQIILRFTHAVRKKFLEFREYLNAGIVNSEDFLLIAINGAEIPHSFLDDEVPYIVKSVLPFGQYTVTIDTNKMKVVNEFYEHRGHIVKRSGSRVPTKAFQEKEFGIIAGLIYSNADLWNLPMCLGSDYLFIHNPLANNELPKGWLPRARSIWVDDEQLKYEAGAGCP